MSYATLDDAVILAKLIEQFSPGYGLHIGLTGGILYKEGPRKDIDLVIYRVRQTALADFEHRLEQLIAELSKRIGLVEHSRHGFVRKFLWGEFFVDLLIPEFPENSEYNTND